MVGESAVGLQKLAAGDIRSQRSQHLAGIETAGAVARVHHNVEALQGPGVLSGAHTLLDGAAQPGSVVLHIAAGLGGTGNLLGGMGTLLGQLQNLSDVRSVQAPCRGEELQAVAVIGMMAGSDLHGAVTGQVQRGPEHGGRGGQSAIQHLDPILCEHPLQRGTDPVSADPGVVTNGHFQTRGLLLQMTLHPHQKRRRDGLNDFIREVDRLAGNSLHCYSSNICTTFQLFVFHTTHPFSRILASL